jgi:coenzyme PQQ biosynthesis protein C
VNALSADELEASLRDIGARRYHRLHPFHKLLHGGACSKGQVQAWALNRYYYQAMIPIKDASLIARCDDSATRREWRSRLVDHDGAQEGEGGIARWLKLTDGLGLPRDYVVSLQGLLPATRFAVDAYVHLVREKTLLEAIASSLTELFSPVIIGERMDGMLKAYDFVTAETLAYFSQRPPQAERDARFALDYVKTYARTPETQHAVLAALEFKCDVLWAMLDALYCASAAAARRAARAQRGAGRLGAARARAGVQGRSDRRRNRQAFHRRSYLCRYRRRSGEDFHGAPRARFGRRHGAVARARRQAASGIVTTKPPRPAATGSGRRVSR